MNVHEKHIDRHKNLFRVEVTAMENGTPRTKLHIDRRGQLSLL